MEDIKIPFFKRVKRAVVNFESYADFATEKIGVAIKYYAKVMLIFAIIIAIVFSYKFSTIVNNEEELQIIRNQLIENGIDLNAIEESINYVKTNNNVQLYITLTLSVTVYMFFTFFILGFFDALIVSIIGFIISRITKTFLKYKAIYIMSLYSLTLPIILNCIYVIVNTLIGFTIDYFSIIYNVIAYIYIITAILMIKTDNIQQQIEVAKIVHEQEKVRQEKDEEKNPDKKDREDKEKDEGENQGQDTDSEPEM